ncbi:uncharacterized protein I206_104957 [Kwoniella pini CBS 10737]|uniref:Alcohol acetyltransferase n=1 Tax=Kwoniella pini CBS 10737 TaxID=1296096 RepID=A0A1B9I8A1_9TREE|nr:uncharacterized protein I206_02496 [Kwoniella pini CBS 10737]OCF51780.1 hypothetical protein I206_02496 [Kwoniella pini CBS 10737]
MTAQDVERRDLSLHERFSLTRRNTGFPAILVFVVVYQNSSDLPSIEFLQKRIKQIQEHFPLLYAKVKGDKTSKPYFESRSEIWKSSDILFSSRFNIKENENEIENIFKKEVSELKNEKDFFNKPSWRITLHENFNQPKKNKAYLTLSIDHIYNDGKGTLNLLQNLLTIKEENDISLLPFEKLSNIPILENTINIKPNLFFLLPIIFNKLFLPKLPLFIQSFFNNSSLSSWPPSTIIRSNPINCNSNQSLMYLSNNLINSLKIISKEKGIKTLHGIFKTIYMISIWSIYKYTLNPFLIKASTPRSERSLNLNHSICTSNYVTTSKIEYILNGKQDFWKLSKLISDELNSIKNLNQGRMDMGMLNYIPDGELNSSKENEPTGAWENFFLNELNSNEPFNESLSISNLGKINLPPKAIDLIWSQEASPFAAPFSANIISHQAGFRMMTVWKEGSAVIEEEVKQLEKVFQGILQKLVNGQEDTSLEALCKI